MKTQHTPTPWIIPNHKAQEIGTIDGKEIAHVVCRHKEWLANAAFIVRAVNSHDDLIAALEALLKLDIKGHQLQDRLQFSDAGRALYAQCKEALNKAKGDL